MKPLSDKAFKRLVLTILYMAAATFFAILGAWLGVLASEIQHYWAEW